MAFHPLSAKSWLLTIYMGNRSDKGLDKWQANLVTTSSVLLSISPKVVKGKATISMQNKHSAPGYEINSFFSTQQNERTNIRKNKEQTVSRCYVRAETL